MTALEFDEEVSKMIEVQYDRALKLLTDNKEKLSEFEKNCFLRKSFSRKTWKPFLKTCMGQAEDNTDDSKKEKLIKRLKSLTQIKKVPWRFKEKQSQSTKT